MREQDWKAQQHSANAGPGSLTGCQCPGGAERPPTTCFSETRKENEEGQAGGTAGGETGAEEVKKKKKILSLLQQITTAKYEKGLKFTHFTRVRQRERAGRNDRCFTLLLFSGILFLLVPRLHRSVAVLNLLCRRHAHKQPSPLGGGR